MAANLGESQSRCVFVETNLDTRLGVLLHEDDTSSDFKDSLCKAHQQCFPQIGEIRISALKIKRGNHLYHCSDSMILSKAFEGINGDWYMYVDAVRSEKCELLSIMAAEQNRSHNNELLQREKEIAIDTNDLSFGGGLRTEVAERTTKKRKMESSDVKKCRKRYSVDLNESDLATTASRCDVDESQVEVNPAKEDTRVASSAQVVEEDYDNQPVEVAENCDGIFGGGKDLASKVEDCEPAGKCFQNVEDTKKQKNNKKGEVDQDSLGEEGVDEVEVKTKKGKRKKKSKEKKKSCEDQKTDYVDEQKNDVEEDYDNQPVKVVENGDGIFGGGKDLARKVEDCEPEGKCVQNVEDAKKQRNGKKLEVDKVEIKTKKRKSKEKKNSCEDQKTDYVDEQKDDVEEDYDNQPVEVVENCDRIFGGGKDLASKVEDCEPERKCVQNGEDAKKQRNGKKLEVDKVEVKTKKRKSKEKKKSCVDHKTDNVDEQKDDVSVSGDEEKPELEGGKLETSLSSSGAEGVDKVDVKTKKKKRKSKEKKKSCENHKTDNVDEKKEDLSVPRDEEKLEFDGEKIETSLSRSGLICNDVALGAASLTTRDLLPRCSCDGQRTRKLVVFDLNGILVDVVQGYRGQLAPDGNISGRSVFRRPFVASFLDFCFERFDVGIWSSRRIGLDYMTGLVMQNHARNLLFCFDQHICITTKFNTLENSTKPLFLKDLRRVWNRIGTCLACGKRKYDETNTLLVDDSPYKALCNPPHTGIFPRPFQFTDRNDSDLGPNGELRKYMERLADAENVQKFVEENPIGQTAINEAHVSWKFYSKVIEAYK